MKSLVFAAIFSLSLSACAQSNGGASTAAVPAAAAAAAPKEPAFAAGTPEAKVRDALHQLEPRIQIESIGNSPITGFKQVIAGGQVLFVSDDGKYLMQGTLLDLNKRQNLSDLAMAGLRKQVMATLPESDRIVFAPKGVTKYTVTVLTDVECGYCRKFHSDIAKYNDLGIRVEYLAFPRAGLGSDDYRKMVAVWCAKDRQKALTDAKSDRNIAAANCARTPVDMQYRAGQRMGLEGTPMILNADGRVLGGYLPPEALLERLNALAKEKTAG